MLIADIFGVIRLLLATLGDAPHHHSLTFALISFAMLMTWPQFMIVSCHPDLLFQRFNKTFHLH